MQIIFFQLNLSYWNQFLEEESILTENEAFIDAGQDFWGGKSDTGICCE